MHSTLKNINNKKPIITPNTVCNKYLQYPDETGKRQAEGGLRLEGKYKQSLKHKPLVTVITVVYNNKASLERCIKSVLEQTYDNIEYIVIDGGSTDGTLDIIKKYEDSIDYFISEPDSGIYYAMNKGISLASGDYINFMNSDDWYLEDAIASIAEYALDHKLSIIYGKVNYCDINENFLYESHSSMIDKNLFNANTIPHQATFYASKVIDITGGYSTIYKIAADAELSYRIKLMNFEYIYIEQVLANYTQAGVSTTHWDLGKLECFFALLHLGIWNINIIQNNFSRLKRTYTKHELKSLLKHLDPLFVDFESLINQVFNISNKGSVLLVNDDIFNPFNSLLISAIKNIGYKCELSCKDFFAKKHSNIIILEWENYLFFDKWYKGELSFDEKLEKLRSILEYYSKFALIISIRHNHNITGHKIKKEETAIAELIYSYCKGITFLGDRYEFYEKNYLMNLHIKDKPEIFALTHPLYTTYPKNYNQTSARTKLGVKEDSTVILSFGALRHQNEIDLLFDTYNKLEHPNKLLLVIGKIDNSIQYDGSKENIIIENRFVSEEEIDLYLNACDIVFLPRLFSLNSGTLFLGISYSKIIVGPKVGNIKNVLEQLDYPMFSNKEEALDALNKGICLLNEKEIPLKNHSKFMKSINVNTLGIQFKNIFSKLSTNNYSNMLLSKISPAPVIIFTYNRVDVLERTIAALQTNYLAQETDLYIFSDGPKLAKPNDIQKVDNVRKFIKMIKGFKSIIIKEQETNIGLANSVISGINEVSQKHEKFIVLEDDLLTSPFFLKYMNESLVKYKEEPKVWCINGMALNPDCLKIPRDYQYDTYFNYRNSSHGWASWSDRWEKAIWDHSQIKYELSDYRQQLLFNRGGNDMYPMMQSQFERNIDSWAIRWSYTISRHDGVCLTPKHSLVTAQESTDGTHIKGYNKLIDNDLSLSLEKVTYPDTLEVNLEIAKRFALNFNPNVPKLLSKEENNLYEPKFSSNYNVGIIGYSKAGGAGIATDRLHQSLLNNGLNSSFINYDKPDLKLNNYRSFDSKENRQTIVNFSQFTNKNIYSGNTIFSFSYPSLQFSDLDAIIKNNDVINLHWIPRILSTEAIAYLSHSNKPIVWTFHDMNPLTGGCHTFHGCQNWKTDCMNCPQLIDNYDNYPAKILAAKKKYFNFENITVVALSNHSKRIIDQSIYKNCRIEVIPNSIEIDVFVPTNKATAKKEFKLPKDKKVIFFLPSFNSTIKGMSELNQALEMIQDKKDEYHILVAGSGSLDYENDDFNITRLGHINDNEKLALAYSAADITIVPSLEETFSNTTAESISCGTPVVGFKIGGLPDMIQDGYSGYTVELGDIKGLADSINKVLEGKNLSKNCREYAEANLGLEVQAKRYKALYEDLLSKPVKTIERHESIPEVFPETAPTVIKLLNEAVSMKEKENNQNIKQRDSLLQQKNEEIKQKDSLLQQKNKEIEWMNLQNIHQFKNNFLKICQTSAVRSPIQKVQNYKALITSWNELRNGQLEQVPGAGDFIQAFEDLRAIKIKKNPIRKLKRYKKLMTVWHKHREKF